MNAIIPQVLLNQQPPRWQQALSELFTCAAELLTFLEIPSEALPWLNCDKFPLRVPKSYALRMKKGDPNDPLLRQVLSIDLESQKNFKYSYDPLDEKKYNPLPGLLHKYPSRVLLTFAPSCAVHCRYCFRRHFPYSENNLGKKGWSPILEYLANKPEIIEVILSGGDPLMASNDTLAIFLKQLSAIQHIKFLRFHTRLPVVIPERIDDDFVKIVSTFRFTTTLVYHINHPAEITEEITEGVRLLQKHGITVLNQSVLLKGINDSLECLKTLSITLFKAGILPYYIHLLDPVQGTAHFEVATQQAKQLQHALRAALPGYLVPRFVREIAGEQSKVPL